MLVMLVAGYHNGGVAENLIRELGVPAWMVGWILGLISSIPEMSGFFETFRNYKQAGSLKGLDDTQEALDALVATYVQPMRGTALRVPNRSLAISQFSLF